MIYVNIFFSEVYKIIFLLLPVLVSENDIQTMHGIDERISIDNFMLGVRVVYNTVKGVCSKSYND